jgi:hypothetical protein
MSILECFDQSSGASGHRSNAGFLESENSSLGKEANRRERFIFRRNLAFVSPLHSSVNRRNLTLSNLGSIIL